MAQIQYVVNTNNIFKTYYGKKPSTWLLEFCTHGRKESSVWSDTMM
jgi:hypothetical protein